MSEGNREEIFLLQYHPGGGNTGENWITDSAWFDSAEANAHANSHFRNTQWRIYIVSAEGKLAALLGTEKGFVR